MRYSNQELKQAANAIRFLSAKAVENAGSGHPGMPLGFADVFSVLTLEFLKFNPYDPKWFGRDRLVLSAGHGCMLLYSFYYLAGYVNFALDDIKKFRQLNSKTAGHPEYGLYGAIETTTGPLGQGISNSVGMAIAGKKYENMLGETGKYKIYCIAGDGCLMEGVSYEAISLAGHLKLDNLVLLFDSNNISIDGKTSLACSEDHIKKFQSMGWDTLEIDGYNYNEIRQALSYSQNITTPLFILCKTTIGYGAPNKSNSKDSHGAPLGKEEISGLTQFLKDSFLDSGLNFELQSSDWEEFNIPRGIFNIWRKCWNYNEDYYNNWFSGFAKLDVAKKAYIETFKVKQSTLSQISSLKINESLATRQSSAKVIEILVKNEEKVIVGSADLSMSNGVINQNTKPITRDDFSGNFIHYGVREHAMGGIMNGLALSGFFAVGATFLMFSDYMRPAIRLSSLMKLNVVYVMTHDSIGLGEDGPTHQPVEQLSTLRAIPDLNVFRPADNYETFSCWGQILQMSNSGKTNSGNLSPSLAAALPSILSLTRQKVEQSKIPSNQYQLCYKGAYVLGEYKKHADLVIFASGSEVEIAAQAHDLLLQAYNHKLKINLISVPCFELFFRQDHEYISQIINSGKLKVAIEASCDLIWLKMIGSDGIFCGVNGFGKSGKYKDVYNYFQLSPKIIADKITQKLCP